MIVELRQYTLKPGMREVLVELFDREFVEPQEELGMRILGTFRDLDREDRFVWMRAFEDMTTRLAGLTAFYTGPVWKEHAALANSTMVDVDDVLLLRPVTDLHLDAPGAGVVVTVHDRGVAVDPGLGLLETAHEVNDFPALPVREGVDVQVRIGREAPDAPAVQTLRLDPTPRSRLR